MAKLVSFVPNLKKNQQKKIAQYLWVVSLVLAVLGAGLVLLTTLNLLNLAKTTLIIKSTLAGYLVKNNLWRLTTGFINTLMTALLGIVFVRSIKPLQNFKRKGWWYLFFICLANIVKVTISALLNFDILSFVSTVILGTLFSLIGFYILRQTKSYFK